MFEEIVGTSPALHAVLANIAKVAPTDSTVLITGETGTGKELVARAIHKHSARAGRPFVSINCAAIPPALIASELFGHERGAFTGAVARREGRFELAAGGTLFLDEVGELPAETQVALLRVLQEHEFERVGSSRPIRADVRIIAATNRDLEAEIAAGRFREDLFYRLNVIPIHIAPLRERREDIPALAEGYLRQHADGRRRFFSPEAMERLLAHPWRGNARELENVIERALALTDAETLGPEDVPLPGAPAAEAPRGEDFLAAAAAHGTTLHELDERYTEQVLRATGGNKVQAARILGIDRKTLYRRAEREARVSATKKEK
jgi:DNA-binding NtrC family response regulator